MCEYPRLRQQILDRYRSSQKTGGRKPSVVLFIKARKLAWLPKASLSFLPSCTQLASQPAAGLAPRWFLPTGPGFSLLQRPQRALEVARQPSANRATTEIVTWLYDSSLGLCCPKAGHANTFLCCPHHENGCTTLNLKGFLLCFCIQVIL